jgi:hypothetical protein
VNDETLRRFFEILNEHTSEVTGWPRHRIVKLKDGRTKRWRTSHERHDAYVHSRFIKTDLLRVNLQRREFPNDGLVSFKDYYKGFFRSKNPFFWAVRKEFLIKTLVLGTIPIEKE